MVLSLDRFQPARTELVFIVESVDVFAMDPRLNGFRIANRVPVYEDLYWQGDSAGADP